MRIYREQAWWGMRFFRDFNLLILLAVVMFAVTGGSLVGPILPEMMNLAGATSKNVGLALSAYTFSAMVATPLLGPVADRFGRKRVIVPAVMLFGVAGLLITFTRSFWLVLVWRALQGIGVGGMLNTVVAAIGDMYQEPDRSRAMGYRITVQGLTNATVPFVSGAIATMAWFLPFYIHSAAIVLAIIAALKLREPAGTSRTGRYMMRALRAIAHTRAVWLFFSNFMGFVLLYGIVVYMPILVVEQFDLTTLHSGLGISVAAGVSALVASQAGRLSSRFPEEIRVLWGFACCGASHLLSGLAPSYPVLLVFMGIWGLGFGVLMPTLNSAAAGLVSTELRAGVLSVFTLLIYLGQTVSPPFFALFVRDSIVRGAFFAGSAAALIPLLFTLYMVVIKGRS
ncbi:MAG: MFS transporter [Desulfobacterales bacterium]|nr:MFS transporter [Desulfobacterales bacterium]